MTKENKEKAINVIKSLMQKMNIPIDERDYKNHPLGWENGYGVEYLENEKLMDGTQKNVYKISFHGKDYEEYYKNGELLHFMEGKKFVAYLDEDFNLLYIGGSHGILELDLV